MTLWTGRFTLTSTRIIGEFALTGEQDSELIGTWEQKPIFLLD